MSKNTSSSAFRKIDIDQYNDDCYKDDDICDTVSSPAGPDEKEVNALLTQGKAVDALKELLRSAPLGAKNQSTKDHALSLIMKVLMAIKATEIERAVSALDVDQIDILMKYIYKGFEFPVENSSGHLLVWHEKTYAAGGVGCIVRVLTDKKRV